MHKYIVATTKEWHIKIFKKKHAFENWSLVSSPDELTLEKISELNPRYIFFPHWSWIVPEEITNNFECVCFHSSDVPYGRGGSPIQNLIIRGHKETKISALKMVNELDAGPVYLKRDLNLAGCAQEIFEKSAIIISDMMDWIAANEPNPVPQEGLPVVFKRRTSNENIMPTSGSLTDIYNHIRMLDVESYPDSHIEYGDFIINFSGANLNKNSIEARVKIVRKP